ncbi:MAG: prepilin-type N-terminal cleavage/methylation domain-containing protein [Gammaproteobacteria bacterium]|nr:prepilin-type N-terminal cleavage/methylation domain-containing protein [Gammaproteobacteria bacterium]MBU1624773.1 prepilin-type N-terminal cleavage/methylation domain-containing protein [Gammaproteobacteria bacterium]MBU1982617.1 prepilin-type N-terminal cleavage/methylation domain-containing protein [Gammaproteobacteria bacterium]
MRKPIQQGFTLIEMIVVIVITGIIAGIVAIFIQAPVQGYVDSARRAELTDIADTAVRRMARDVRMAVPNSVVLSGCPAACAVEYLATKDGGRYRAGSGGTGNVLDFGVADGSFEIIGTGIDFTAGALPDFIVVGSSQSDAVPPYVQTAAGVLRQYSGAAGVQTIVNFTNTALPTWAELPSQRFDVVDGAQQAVTYACEGVGPLDASGNGTGQLVRHWGYGFDHDYSAAPESHAVLADRVSACNITYTVANQRFGLLTISLTLTSENESVSLYNEIHVNNAP